MLAKSDSFCDASWFDRRNPSSYNLFEYSLFYYTKSRGFFLFSSTLSMSRNIDE